MTTGRQVKADEAAKLGLIDEVRDGDPKQNGIDYTQSLLDVGAPRRPVSEMETPAAIDWDGAFEAILARGRGQISPHGACVPCRRVSRNPLPKVWPPSARSSWT